MQKWHIISSCLEKLLKGLKLMTSKKKELKPDPKDVILSVWFCKKCGGLLDRQVSPRPPFDIKVVCRNCKRVLWTKKQPPKLEF